MLGYFSTFMAVVSFVVLAFSFGNAAPNRQRGAPGFRAPRKLTSTRYGEALEYKMRLGVDKKGLDEDWTVESAFQQGRLRESPMPVEYVAPRPQLNGNMGDSGAPRSLSRHKQYHPKSYVAPNPRLSSTPGALKTLTESERIAIATQFWVNYKYTSNQLSDMKDLIKTTQRNYGLVPSGLLDDQTITAMMKPRCGFPDRPAEYNTFPSREHWTNKNVTYHIKGYTPDMSQCQTRNAFKRAFRTWEEVTDLTFEKVERDDADIIIYFGHVEHGDGYPFDGANGLLAHAFTPGTEPLSGDSHFDEAEFWTLGKGRVFDTYNGNSGGNPCVFPFYFKDTTYSSCTNVGRDDGLEWCSTTSDFDKDGKWAFCPHELLFTYGGNSDSDPCVFPFVFLGTSYDECTYEGRGDGYRWCATTSNYDNDARWGFCPNRAHGTDEGNAGGASCKFPFTFEGYEYLECTTQGRSDYKLWCATTDNYDTDGQWGFCNGDGYSLFLVATHEFGHAIGLDHSNVPGALMYPVYSYHADFVLPDDDMRGARDLYGGGRTIYLPPLQLEQCGGDLTQSETSSTSPPRTRPTTAICDASVEPQDMCERRIDAIMLYQRELFVFQGPFVWRVSGRGKNQRQILSRVASHWPALDQQRTPQGCRVDAVYQRPHDLKLVFFQGSKYYVFDGPTAEPGYPREVTELGLPPRTVVDDVVYMGTRNPDKGGRRGEERTYYFVGDKVYRANVRTGVVMEDVDPTTLGSTDAWKDLPVNVDAVYRESQTKPYTMFVRGKKVYRYQNKKGKVDYTRGIKKIFYCPPKPDTFIALPLREQ